MVQLQDAPVAAPTPETATVPELVAAKPGLAITGVKDNNYSRPSGEVLPGSATQLNCAPFPCERSTLIA
jgi:hypothetical protein